MPWQVTSTQNEEAWLDDYIHQVLTTEPASLPPHDLTLGSVASHWYEVEPGIAYVGVDPDTGTPADRTYVAGLLVTRLATHGYKPAVYTLRWDHADFQKHGTWADVEAKAKRLVQTGAVTLLNNTPDTVLGSVQGDHGVYRTEIRKQDPNNPMAITGSHCDCDWGQYQNLPRTRQWKRFQNRSCAHILATWWQSMGIDAYQRNLQQQQNPDQGSLFDTTPSAAPGSMGLMQRSPIPNPNAWFMQPGAPPNQFNQFMPGGGASPQALQGYGDMPPLGQAPSPADSLPPFPMAEQPQLPPVNPVSIPGGRPGPTPTNPIQYPGGTFSSVHSDSLWHMSVDQQYQNGQLARLKNETVGTLMGRSEAHGAGQSVTIPAGSVGEVLGTDPTTQMVNVLFMGDQFSQNSFFEPFGATAWCWPSEIAPSGNRPPGPAIRRNS